MMHYYNENWQVQNPEASLNQWAYVGGNNSDLQKTFDVLTVFTCKDIFSQTECENLTILLCVLTE